MKLPKPGRFSLTLRICVMALAALASTGCTRTFWRRQADVDAYALVREKATHPHWRLPNYTISVDPRSRMYDPYLIDCSPLPPDDPTAHQFMHCVDNKRGWPFWHDNGDRPHVENAAWPEYINIDERGVLKISVDDAVRLALLHSKDYQQQLETVYLSALDVSIERFRFDSQFFAGYTTFGTWTGPGNTGNSSSQLTASNFTQKSGAVGLGNLTNSTPLGILGSPATNGFWSVNKAFTTGGQLVVNFANQLVWQFSGDDNFTPTTVLNFSLIQPLLRGAGRDRIMEQLTLAERLLLYNVRIMEQYRQAFYVDTVVGGGTNNSTPTRGGSGGALGQGLSGFSGVGTSGFGNITIQGGGGGTQPAPQGAQNFIGLLQQQRIVRNQEDAVLRLRRNLARLNILLEQQPPEQTGEFLTQALQVAQTRQALLGNEVNLINLRNVYLASIDNFKVGELFLPPQICMEPDDPLLDPFDLIDQEIIRLPEDWEEVLLSRLEVRRAIPERIQDNVEVIAQEGAPPVCRLNRYPELQDDLQKLCPAFEEMQRFAENITQKYLPAIRSDIEKMKLAVPRRKVYLERLITRIAAAKDNPCDLLPLRVDPLETAGGGKVAAALLTRLDGALAEAEQKFENLNANFGRYAEALASRGRIIDQLIQDGTQPPDQLFELLVRTVFDPQYECGKTRVLTIDIVEEMTRELIELQLLQAVARAEAIEVNEVDVSADHALEVTRRYRRDWMNRRAQLVDSWRRLQFNADQLQAQLDVFLTGTMNNIDSNNPFSLRANTGTLRAGVQFDTPLNRLSERNSYRQALIEYQQARRNYYNFEDSVAQALRGYLRQITAFQINFETNRLAVIEAARQVMLNTFIDQEGQRTATTRATAARDAVQGLTDLNNAQNQFMLTFISYEIARLQLDFNMGTMQLDDDGLWIDPGKMGPDYGKYDPWLWRDSPGSIGENTGEFNGQELDRQIDELPPPFLLPTPPGEALPPMGVGNPAVSPRKVQER